MKKWQSAPKLYIGSRVLPGFRFSDSNSHEREMNMRWGCIKEAESNNNLIILLWELLSPCAV